MIQSNRAFLLIFLPLVMASSCDGDNDAYFDDSYAARCKVFCEKAASAGPRCMYTSLEGCQAGCDIAAMYGEASAECSAGLDAYADCRDNGPICDESGTGCASQKKAAIAACGYQIGDDGQHVY